MKLVTSQRFYAVYSGVLTATLAVVLFSGFDAQENAASRSFKEITVERINIVEPDGTLRMIVSNKARAPGIFIKGKEHLPGQHANTAGMIFLNDEGTENGGLIFSGSKDANGNISSSGHLSFDRYMQDQVLTMSALQENDQRRTTFNVLDQPSWSIEEYTSLIERISDLPPAEQERQINEFVATHPSGHRRLSLGRETDQSVGLDLKDTEGRTRALLKVDADGTPRLQFLDERGNVISQLPQS